MILNNDYGYMILVKYCQKSKIDSEKYTILRYMFCYSKITEAFFLKKYDFNIIYDLVACCSCQNSCFTTDLDRNDLL